MSIEYDHYLDNHRHNVYKAYEWIKMFLPEVIPEDSNLEWMTSYAHDLSKNHSAEYDAYDDYFYGEERTPEVIENFNRAWLHHIHNNPHHWQYWVLVNDNPDEGEIILEMPKDYALEMVCDWLAFSIAKVDLSEIFKWYDERKEYIKLHPATRDFVEEVLDKIKKRIIEGEE